MTAALPEPASLTLFREAPIPVAVLTGFLGSGKTTLIRSLLRNPAFEGTAVIVNEFGEIGLDHLLVEAAEEDTVLLAGGCLCCATRGDLVRALRSLLDRRERAELPAYQRVIVETSGLADPTPILQTLMSDPLRLSLYRPAGLTATVDCLLGIDSLASYGEAVRQVALADRILITKTDLADAGRLDAAMDAIRRVTRAPISTAASRQGFGAELFRPFPWSLENGGPEVAHRHGAPAHGAYVSVTRSFDRPLAWSRVQTWLDEAVERCGPGLLRLKAILAIEGKERPVAIHAVQHVIHRPEPLTAWPDGLQQGRILVVGHGLDRAFLGRMLDDLAG